MSGKMEQAEKAYKESASIENTNFDAQFKLGAIAKARGDTAEMHRIQLILANLDPDVAAEYSASLECGTSC